MKVKVKTAKRQNNKNLNKIQNDTRSERRVGRRGRRELTAKKRAGERQTLIRLKQNKTEGLWAKTGACRREKQTRRAIRSAFRPKKTKRTTRRRGMEHEKESNSRGRTAVGGTGWQWVVGGIAQVPYRVECTPRQSETADWRCILATLPLFPFLSLSLSLSLRMRKVPNPLMRRGGNGQAGVVCNAGDAGVWWLLLPGAIYLFISIHFRFCVGLNENSFPFDVCSAPHSLFLGLWPSEMVIASRGRESERDRVVVAPYCSLCFWVLLRDNEKV